jgi:hypothetical protein
MGPVLPYMATYAPAPAPAARPTGVTILAVLAAIGAVGSIMAGLALLALGGFLASAGADAGLFAALGAAGGVLLLLLAAVYAASAWGLWTRKRWAWYLALAAVGLQLLTTLMSLVAGDIGSGIIGLLIAGLVGWYLLSPAIQAWFGVSHKTPWSYPAK